jgi:hypothetical protein
MYCLTSQNNRGDLDFLREDPNLARSTANPNARIIIKKVLQELLGAHHSFPKDPLKTEAC